MNADYNKIGLGVSLYNQLFPTRQVLSVGYTNARSYYIFNLATLPISLGNETFQLNLKSHKTMLLCTTKP